MSTSSLVKRWEAATAAAGKVNSDVMDDDGPPKRQDKLSSLTNGTTKLVRRLGGYTKKQPIKNISNVEVAKEVQKPTPLKILPNLEVGKEVQFEYNGTTVNGTVRYIGSADFSPGKWCGIELTENIGKHNGTVNGRCYFVCRDSYGVFIRFSKVADKLSPKSTSEPSTPTETESPSGTQSPTSTQSSTSHIPTPKQPPTHTETSATTDPDMRITVKSIKSTPISSTSETENIITNGEIKAQKAAIMTNGNIKSSVKSYIKSKKDKKLTTKELLNGIRKEKEKASKETAKNVVVSSFTAPVPVQPVVVSPQESNTDDDAAPLSPDTDYDDVFLLNNISPEETSTDADTTVTEESIEVTDTVSVETPNALTPDTENESDAMFSESESQRGDVDTDTCSEFTSSRIPRRIKSIHKTPHPLSDVTTPDKPVKPVPCNDTTAKNRKMSRDRHHSESDKTSIPVKIGQESEKPASLAKTPFRSSKRNLEFNRGMVNNKTSEQEKLKSVGNSKTNEFDKQTSQFRSSTPSLPRKPVVTPFVARKAPTPVLPRKNNAQVVSKIQPPRSLSIKETKKDPVIEETGGKNADSATVMGNASVINASCIKKTPDSDADVNVNMGMPETIEASVVQNEMVLKRTKEAKTKKTQVKGSSNKFTKEDAKELQKEVDNLQNQLKERTDRINELEITLKNNNNNKLEERNEFERRHTELENQLNIKNLNIIEIEGKFTTAQSLIKKSSRSFEALGIVLQYYLKQIALVTKQLSEALEEKTKLEGKNGELSKETEGVKLELQEIMKKLDAEKCRCETLQNDLESLALSHEAEINALVERHNSEHLKLEESLKKEKEKGIKKAKEDYRLQIEQLKADHQTEIHNLNNVHQNQIQEVLQEKGNSINELVTSHGSALKAKEAEHAKAIEDLEKIHATKYNELMERLNATVTEKSKVEKRLEEILKELESDNRIQTALLPYKHLPEELQSLQVVLELRNEEIKNHRLKNMELQKKVDEYYELKTRFDSISQENQSLKESLRKRALSERKLSVERDTLLEKFENELKKVDMLAMEKEQLMWRASNPDLSASLPNVFEDAEDEGCSMSPLRSSGSFSTSPPITFAPAKLKRRSMNMNNTIPLSKSDYQLH